MACKLLIIAYKHYVIAVSTKSMMQAIPDPSSVRRAGPETIVGTCSMLPKLGYIIHNSDTHPCKLYIWCVQPLVYFYKKTVFLPQNTSW